MSLKSALLMKIGINDVNQTFEKLYGLSFSVQNFVDIDQERKRNLKIIKDYTHVNYHRLKSLWDLTLKLTENGVNGAFVETGVWKGGCSGILSLISKNTGYKNSLYFFDSFEGLPQPTKEDGKEAIEFAEGKDTGKLEPINRVCVDESYIKDLLFNKLEIDPTKVNIIKGWFQDTIPKYKSSIGEIALLRLDGDWYESTKVPLENLYDQVISGGYIVIDDYNYWDGCKKAVDEFILDRNLKVDIIKQDVSGAYFIKP